MLADFAVLSQDFMSVPDEAIKGITAMMTVVGGKIVYADSEFKDHDVPLPPASPDWSPVRAFGGYQTEASLKQGLSACAAHGCSAHGGARVPLLGHDGKISRWLGLEGSKKPSFENPWALGCGCFAY